MTNSDDLPMKATPSRAPSPCAEKSDDASKAAAPSSQETVDASKEPASGSVPDTAPEPAPESAPEAAKIPAPPPPSPRDADLRVAVPPDGSEARIVDFVAAANGGKPLSETLVLDALAEAGVFMRPRREALDTLFERVAAGSSPVGIVLTESSPPVHGDDGRVEFKIRMTADIGTLGEDDRVNYHERGIVASVSRGQQLAVVSKPTEGVPGTDVRGEPIPPRPGRPAEFRAGPGVSLSQDGTSASASIDGMVQFVRGVLSVTDTFEVAGDVDFKTGNIHMNHGSVSVRGVVRDGFEVGASGNVVVHKEIESAILRSGGDVEVRHGVLAGRIEAAGSIFAKFAVNATLVAGGDVVVANNLYTCDVTSGGRIVASSGKGVIRGGVLRCARGLEVNELGALSETPTEVIVDADNTEEQTLLRELAEVEESIALVYQHLGEQRLETSTLDAQAEVALGWERVRENLAALQNQKADIKDRLWELRRTKQRELRASVTIKRIAYPGVSVRLGGLVFAPERPIEKCALYYDIVTDQIACVPL